MPGRFRRGDVPRVDGGEQVPPGDHRPLRGEGFNVGNNKAFNYARALLKGRVVIVTDKITPKGTKRPKLEWAPTLQAPWTGRWKENPPRSSP
jgi:hypothetical protein